MVRDNQSQTQIPELSIKWEIPKEQWDFFVQTQLKKTDNRVALSLLFIPVMAIWAVILNLFGAVIFGVVIGLIGMAIIISGYLNYYDRKKWKQIVSSENRQVLFSEDGIHMADEKIPIQKKGDPKLRKIVLARFGKKYDSIQVRLMKRGGRGTIMLSFFIPVPDNISKDQVDKIVKYYSDREVKGIFS